MMLSHYLTALAILFTSASSAPTPAPTSPGLATIDLRIIGPQNTHYLAGDQQSTSDQSQHLTIIVGQTLSLDHDPLHIQGLQIASVKAGESLSLLSTSIEEDDQRIVCSARVKGREDLLQFDMHDQGVLLAAGRLVKVTRLSCSIDGEAA